MFSRWAVTLNATMKPNQITRANAGGLRPLPMPTRSADQQVAFLVRDALARGLHGRCSTPPFDPLGGCRVFGI
jgi:hypothetical protein